jgi:drug/metabolite transporter (DMT)-like permease
MIGPLLCLASSFIWSIGTTAFTNASHHNPVQAVNFTRALFAAPFFIVWSLIAGHSFASLQSEHWGWICLSMFTGYALADLCFLEGIRRIGLVAGMAISAIYPLWSGLYAWFVLGDPFTTWNLLGLLLTVGGVVLVILGDSSEEHRKPERLISGVLYALSCSFLWALHSFVIGKLGNELPIPVMNATRMSMALIFVPLLGLILSREYRRRPRLIIRTEDLKKTGWAFALEAWGGTFAYSMGMALSGLAVGAALSSLAPVFSIPIAWLFLRERPRLLKSAGSIAVVAGVILLV